MGSKNVEERKEKAESRRGTIDLSSLLNRDVSFFLRKRNRKKNGKESAKKNETKRRRKKDKRIKIKLQKMKKRRGESKMRFKKFAIKEEEGGRLARSLGRAILWDNQTGDYVWQ